MLDKIITKLIMKHLSRCYKKQQEEFFNYNILCIKGTGGDYPKYLIYTENERVRGILEDV